ncbi:MAG: hypothetical protein K2I71_02755 [Helicobacter sp.]|nr:hypothetical protein [Helicobacter sp.]
MLFDDPKSKQRVALRLDNANLQKLKDAFGDGDFYVRKDGIIRLNGKAESFVSGWFGDIAYRQGYLEADSNKDGIINEKERNVLKTGAGSTGVVDGTIAKNEAIFGYIKGGENSFLTIQDALNAILAKDKNLDGNLERIGEYQSEEEAKKWTMETINRVMGNNYGGNITGYMMDDSTDDILAEAFSGEWIAKLMDQLLTANEKLADDIKKMLEEMQKTQMERKERGESTENEKSLEEIQTQQQALQELKNNGGNVNALSAEQKKSLVNLVQKDKISDEEMQSLQKQVDLDSFNAISDVVGMPKEVLQKLFKAL